MDQQTVGTAALRKRPPFKHACTFLRSATKIDTDSRLMITNPYTPVRLKAPRAPLVNKRVPCSKRQRQTQNSHNAIIHMITLKTEVVTASCRSQRPFLSQLLLGMNHQVYRFRLHDYSSSLSNPVPTPEPTHVNTWYKTQYSSFFATTLRDRAGRGLAGNKRLKGCRATSAPSIGTRCY